MRNSLSISEWRIANTRFTLTGLMILWIIACLIALIGLGNVPLRDFDEATVARVAFELSHKRGIDFLLPTLWNEPYFNKAPGLHWLIATVISLTTEFNKLPSDFVVRIVPALLSTFVVPLGGLIQFYLRPKDSLSALSTSAILLTLLPVARHGRLAMLDGTQLTAIAFLWFIFLSFQDGNKYSLKSFLFGISISLMLLLKAPLLIPTLLAIVLSGFIGRNIKFNLNSISFCLFLVGLLPGISWHLFHFFQRGVNAFWLWSGDGVTRVLFDAGEGSNLGFLVPLIEIFEGGWPWLFLWPLGFLLAINTRHTSWGQWILGTTFIFVIAIFPLRTQLPWYSHPLWLPFSLTCGPLFSGLIHKDRQIIGFKIRFLRIIPLIWSLLGFVFLLIGFLGITQFFPSMSIYSSILFPLGIGWLLGSQLLLKKDFSTRFYGGVILIFGNIIALIFLMNSNFWLWELNETLPVQPIEEMLSITNNQQVFIQGNSERPSLSWYAGKRIQTLNNSFRPPGWILERNLSSNSSTFAMNECTIVRKDRNWNLNFCKLE